jgi:alpha-tubulin suppressor-like RCC1 family protein
VGGWGRAYHASTLSPPVGLKATQLAAGFAHTCALRSDKGVSCWGYDITGVVSSAPTTTDGTQISGGYHHSCVLRSTGEPSCWGTEAAAQVPANLTGTQLFSGANFNVLLK